MLSRLREFIQFQVERFLLGGPHYRLLFLAALIGLVSLSGGTILYHFDAGAGDEPWIDAVWWAFLRLTDPGYLGDDQGVLRRSLATVITVLGYVLFMGALIAVLTQWLNQTIRRLEMGLTPVALRRHVVVLGWTDHTPELVAELTSSQGRLRRFLRAAGARRLRVAILGEEIGHEHDVALRQRLGVRYRWSGIVLRSGSMLQPEHLQRVDAWRATTVVVPSDVTVADARMADPDARLVKTMLTLAKGAGSAQVPILVAAVRDARKVPMLQSAYPPGRAELIAVDAIIGRILAQTLRHPGLTAVIGELLDQAVGNELYIRPQPDLVGRSMRDVAHAFRDAVVLGMLRDCGKGLEPILNPDGDEVLRSDDRLILLAETFDVRRAPMIRRHATAPAQWQTPTLWSSRKVMILGWSHLMPALLRELGLYPDEKREIDMASTIAIGTRSKRLAQAGIDVSNLTLRHHECDIAVPAELEALPFADVDAVVILGSDRLESAEDADARSLATHHILRSLMQACDPAAGGTSRRDLRVIVELRDPANAGFFADASTEVLVSGVVISHVLAQIALRRELGVVYDALLGPGGSEFAFIRAQDLGLSGRTVTFADCIDQASALGFIALGLRPAGEAPQLNPQRERSFTLRGDDCLVVLRRT